MCSTATHCVMCLSECGVLRLLCLKNSLLDSTPSRSITPSVGLWGGDWGQLLQPVAAQTFNNFQVQQQLSVKHWLAG